MARAAHARDGLTLEEFLRLPEIDERPYLEYFDGRIEAKVAPQKRHCRIAKRLVARFDDFAAPGGLGEAFPELRCTFGGRSIVADVGFLLAGHIEYDERGRIVDETSRPPDLHVEVISPDQSQARAHRNLLHSATHGCPLGLLIHPARQTIDVYRPGRPPERLPADGSVEGEPILPEFRLPAAEVWSWLARPEGDGRDEGGEPA